MLIVDDHVDMTEALCVLFSVLGQEMRTARTAMEGLRVVREYEPHLLLLDIGLPDLDGYELARRVRGSGATRMYIVAVTGWCREEDRARALAAGCDLHIPKPLDVESIRAAIVAARLRAAHGVGARPRAWRMKHHLD